MRSPWIAKPPGWRLNELRHLSLHLPRQLPRCVPLHRDAEECRQCQKWGMAFANFEFRKALLSVLVAKNFLARSIHTEGTPLNLLSKSLIFKNFGNQNFLASRACYKAPLCFKSNCVKQNFRFLVFCLLAFLDFVAVSSQFRWEAGFTATRTFLVFSFQFLSREASNWQAPAVTSNCEPQSKANFFRERENSLKLVQDFASKDQWNFFEWHYRQLLGERKTSLEADKNEATDFVNIFSWVVLVT